tara:strand:- start:3208 stop:3402 length:195 start_codon:yes stop_codon:yes gene_type:complete
LNLSKKEKPNLWIEFLSSAGVFTRQIRKKVKKPGTQIVLIFSSKVKKFDFAHHSAILRSYGRGK